MKKFLVTVTALFFTLLAYTQSPSLLSEGDWYQIKTVEPGIYRLTFSHLNSLGINMSTLNPVNIKMYGNGGGMLPHAASAPLAQDFEEIAIYVNGQQNGVFNFFDYILFYGGSTTTLKYDETSQLYEHQLNHFADTTIYYFTIADSPGKRIDTINQSSLTPTDKILTYPDYVFHEAEIVNPLNSGRQWLGEEFTDANPQQFNFSLINVNPLTPLTIKWQVAALSDDLSTFNLMLNDLWIDSLNLAASLPLGHIRSASKTITSDDLSPDLLFSVDYESTAPESKGWLDYISINFRREMKMAGEQFHFRDPLVVGSGLIGEYTIADATDDLMVWDITDHNNASRVDATFSPETRSLSFVIPVEELYEFVATSPREFMAPVEMIAIPNQNIRGLPAADMLIISHPSLLTEAQQLATFHITHSGLTVHAIDVKMIYNEFSSGKQDVTAIRDMIRFFYDKAAEKNESLQYVLMFGMGSYDYRNRITPNSNLVPVYQSLNSLDPILSYNTDDFFATLQDGNGDWDMNMNSEPLDVAIGRLPATNAVEAKAMVDKIIHYSTNDQKYGQWRNVYTLVADDGDTGLHMNATEAVGETVEQSNPVFNQKKIYLDQFELQQTPDGPRYPEANEAIKQALNQGTLVFNYIGHSGPEGLAAERVLTAEDISALDNHDKLPLFIVMGSKYVNISDPGILYQGNDLMLREEQGAIAVIAPTAPVYASPNLSFNNALTNFIHTNSGPARVGNVMKQAKNEMSHVQNRRHALLGDPATQLSLPEQITVIDSVIGIAYQIFADTLAPAQGVVIKGSVIDHDGNVISGFGGTINLTLYERAYPDTTLGNQGDPFILMRRDDVILTVDGAVSDGKFEAQFQLPGELDREYGDLKLSWYALGTNADAAGAQFLMAGGGPFGIDDDIFAESLVNIYPTITRDLVFVDFLKQNHGFTNLSIINLAGNEVSRQNIAGKMRVQLSLGNLPSGIYIAVIQGNEYSVRRKLMVQ
ncbi:MAG: type IX secretion system sortase PorU [Bacteroidales bacterium]|nr:type IX secretion system sortase PorU [Bacteroidales bacterium]